MALVNKAKPCPSLDSFGCRGMHNDNVGATIKGQDLDNHNVGASIKGQELDNHNVGASIKGHDLDNSVGA